MDHLLTLEGLAWRTLGMGTQAQRLAPWNREERWGQAVGVLLLESVSEGKRNRGLGGGELRRRAVLYGTS